MTSASAFSYLDDSSFRELYCLGPLESPSIKFFVRGIRCSKCIAKLESLQNDEVQSLEVDLGAQTLLARMKSQQGSIKRLAEQIEALGFTPSPVLSQNEALDQFKKETRQDLIRLAIAGFCAGNIMLFAVSIYFGLDGALRRDFEILQFLLYIPVVSFVAWPFYKGFYQGLRSYNLSIDGPMAIASLSGFAMSLWHLGVGHGNLYFDSLSGFLFLILATRYWQKRTRFEHLKFLRPSVLAESLKARKLINTTEWSWARADQLFKGDKVVCYKDDWVPADGFLQSSMAVFDLSLLSGESAPRIMNEGCQIHAGAKLLSDRAEIRVEKTGQDTFLGKILQGLRAEPDRESQTAQLSDRASQILLIVIFSMAGLLLLTEVPDRFERALALIILACPCAMAFGTPLALAFAMKKAQGQGILVKSSRVFEKILEIKTICLDKTGTVTERAMTLTSHSEQESDSQSVFYKKIILSLETISHHPVAMQLRFQWLPQIEASTQGWTHLEEIPHLGVQGRLRDQQYCFQAFHRSGIKYYGLFKGCLQKQRLVLNGDPNFLWSFRLEPGLKPSVQKVIQRLQHQYEKVFMISGDSEEETQRVGQGLGLVAENIISNLNPLQKQKFVNDHDHVLMVGDGINDSLALKAAHVGVAVHGSVDVAMHSADVFLLSDDLQSLTQLFAIAELAQSQVRRNLGTALIYNSFGAVLAILGFVNPWVAALLMPLSSLFIFLTTWRRLR